MKLDYTQTKADKCLNICHDYGYILSSLWKVNYGHLKK